MVLAVVRSTKRISQRKQSLCSFVRAMGAGTLLQLPGSSVCSSSVLRHRLSKGVSQTLLSLHMATREVGGKKEGLRVWSFPMFTKMLSHNYNNNKKEAVKPFGRPPFVNCMLLFHVFVVSASVLLS